MFLSNSPGAFQGPSFMSRQRLDRYNLIHSARCWEGGPIGESQPRWEIGAVDARFCVRGSRMGNANVTTTCWGRTRWHLESVAHSAEGGPDSKSRLNLVAGRLTVPNIESRCNQLKLGHPPPRSTSNYFFPVNRKSCILAIDAAIYKKRPISSVPSTSTNKATSKP